jgi:uncharacterized BrkB/YihY/UPF0761 family membrane protein
VRSIIEFGKKWYSNAAGPLRSADPLLMGAAFAYNSLFAAVPLALAFVSLLTLLDSTQDVLLETYQFINERLPSDIADLLIQILSESVEAVEDNRVVIIIVTLLIALWSGSRAVYTLQKALRLVENTDVDLGYVHMRGVGMLVTVAAGIGVFAAYAVLVAGMGWLGRIAPEIPDNFVISELAFIGVAAGWVFLLLNSVYRWGAPEPIRRPAVASTLVTAVLVVGTWIAVNLVPSGSSASVAVFGSIGLILLWLYGVGFTVIAGPIAVGSLLKTFEKE